MQQANLNRKRLRLEGYNYNVDGVYFITSRIRLRDLTLGIIRRGKVVLNVYGHIVQSCWIDLQRFYDSVILDNYVVMPNHFHGLVNIMGSCAQSGERRQHAALSKIIGSFKAFSGRYINEVRDQQGVSIWQRSFHDRIVRNDDELFRIRKYIHENPLNEEIHYEAEMSI